MKLLYTLTALQHLEEIGSYIARDSPQTAEHIFHKIRATIETLALFPFIGHPGHVDNTLEFVVPGLPYVVAYRIADPEIHILGIFHGAQNR